MARPLCKWCERKSSLSSMDYCSLEHLKLDMEYRKINLPKSFLQRLKIRCTPAQKESELKSFASRHKYDEALVVKKANNLIGQIQ